MAGYEIQASHQSFQGFSGVSQIGIEGGTRGPALQFSFNLGFPAYTYWRVVPINNEGNPGEPSNVVSTALPPKPLDILYVNPLGGQSGAEVTFTAYMSGTPPFNYEWDFGGGADPSLLSASGDTVSATVTLRAIGAYPARVTVSDTQNNTDTYNFTLTVSEVPGNPPEVISVTPTGGDSGTEVTFTAEVTGDTPLTYTWNFGGGASPNIVPGVIESYEGASTQVTATVTLGRGGDLWERVRNYPASLTLTNSEGEARTDFPLGVRAWWHISTSESTTIFDDTIIAPNPIFFGEDGSPRGYLRPSQGQEYSDEVWLVEWLDDHWELSQYILTVDAGGPRIDEFGNLHFTRGGGLTGGSEIRWFKWDGTDLTEEVAAETNGLLAGFFMDVDSAGQPVYAWEEVGGTPTRLMRTARRIGLNNWEVRSYPELSPPFPRSMVLDAQDRIVVVLDADPLRLVRLDTDGWTDITFPAGVERISVQRAPNGQVWVTMLKGETLVFGPIRGEIVSGEFSFNLSEGQNLRVSLAFDAFSRNFLKLQLLENGSIRSGMSLLAADAWLLEWYLEAVGSPYRSASSEFTADGRFFLWLGTYDPDTYVVTYYFVYFW